MPSFIDIHSGLTGATEDRRRAEPLTGHGFAGTRMVLTDPAGGSYAVLRTAPTFRPMEYARLQALIRVSGALALPDGAELLIRPAVADDAGAVRRMHTRSSATSRQRRYFSGLLCPPEAKLRHLLEPPGGITLLAVHLDPHSGAEQVVAMANLLAEGQLGEVAVLVEDDWHRHGIGTALLRGLAAYASEIGFAALVAHAAADNVPMLRTLRRLGYGSPDRDGPMISLTRPLPGGAPQS